MTPIESAFASDTLLHTIDAPDNTSRNKQAAPNPPATGLSHKYFDEISPRNARKITIVMLKMYPIANAKHALRMFSLALANGVKKLNSACSNFFYD